MLSCIVPSYEHKSYQIPVSGSTEPGQKRVPDLGKISQFPHIYNKRVGLNAV